MNHTIKTIKLPPLTPSFGSLLFLKKKKFQKELDLRTIKRLSNWGAYHKPFSHQTHLAVLSIFRNYFQQNLQGIGTSGFLKFLSVG